MNWQHQHDPRQNGSADTDGHDILPPVEPAALGGERAAFPPLGTTLPAYRPALQGVQGGVSAGRPLAIGRPQPSSGRRFSFKTWFKRVIISLLVALLMMGGYVGYKVALNASKTFGGSLFGLLHTQHLSGEAQGRVNILLAGNSSDDPGHSGADLTDSIMLVSLDTRDNTAFMLSIPRDLWVDIPGDGYSKINAAYVYGQANHFSEGGYPDGGMGELENVVEQDFGVTINYYALVDYAALRDAVDAVGGIDVNIQSSDPRGLYDPSRDWTSRTYAPLVRLSNGEHHLDGQQALNLARARGDAYGSYGYAGSDYTRTANQRLMLAALKDRATSAGVLANPVKVGELMDSLGNNVQTDFQTNEIRRLVSLVQKIPGSAIKSVSLNDDGGKNLLRSYRAYGGQSALIPAAGLNNYSAIQAYLQQLMAPPAQAPSNSSDAPAGQ